MGPQPAPPVSYGWTGLHLPSSSSDTRPTCAADAAAATADIHQTIAVMPMRTIRAARHCCDGPGEADGTTLDSQPMVCLKRQCTPCPPLAVLYGIAYITNTETACHVVDRTGSPPPTLVPTRKTVGAIGQFVCSLGLLRVPRMTQHICT